MKGVARAAPRRVARIRRASTPPDAETARFVAHARFRFALRRFLRFSEDQARAAGVTPAQHQLLLAIRGSRQAWLSVGAIARALLIRPHSAVGLVERAVRDGLVSKSPDPADLRRVRVVLTSRGNELISALTAAHRAELRRLWRQVPRLR